MVRVVSVSLGSSRRDQRVETTLLGVPIVMERIGVDGDLRRARALFLELDGKVDAFGVGGADLGITVAGHNYPLYSVSKLIEGVRTPAVDGSGVRRVVERLAAQRLEQAVGFGIAPKRVLICTAVARYDMARGFADMGYEALYGDFGFGFGLPIALHSLVTLERLARLLLPIMGRLPLRWLYPLGEAQEKIVPRFENWYNWATVVADDFHYVKQHLPARLDGKIVVTNTTTRADVELLRSRGARALVTTTPRLEGRSFGTNVLEAALVAIAGKGRALTPDEIAELVRADEWMPDATTFQQVDWGKLN